MKQLILFYLTLMIFAACQSNYPKNSDEQEQSEIEMNVSKQISDMKPSENSEKKDTVIENSYLMGKFNPAKHPNLMKIPQQYTTKTNIYLRKKTMNAFIKMHNAAKKDGIDLIILSATRNFYSQKSIWDAKWNGSRLVEGKNLAKTISNAKKRTLKILEYSSMPGTSRHHWGTDIDINNLNPAYFKSGKGKKEYEWLVKNAPKFGFCQVYTKKGEDRPNGYEEEHWHWSYLPISKKLTQAYAKQIKNSDIKGFSGSESAVEIDMVKNYVLGINTDCQ